MKIAISGSNGFVGSQLKKKFPDHISIGRNDTHEIILSKLQDVDVVINLAGAPIIKRWSTAYKNVLFQSRIDTTNKLVKAINESNITHFISTSAIGAYPDNLSCDEHCKTYSKDFLGQLTQAWEDAASLCQKPTTILRFGVVLSREGGSLSKMLWPFKLGLGGVIGDGNMMMSWISMRDLMAVYDFIMAHQFTGIVNAVSPHPISNHTFTKSLGKVLHVPTILPLPPFVLKIIYGEGASVITGSKEVYPKLLMDEGFNFNDIHIDKALETIFSTH